MYRVHRSSALLGNAKLFSTAAVVLFYHLPAVGEHPGDPTLLLLLLAFWRRHAACSSPFSQPVRSMYCPSLLPQRLMWLPWLKRHCERKRQSLGLGEDSWPALKGETSSAVTWSKEHGLESEQGLDPSPAGVEVCSIYCLWALIFSSASLGGLG